MTKTAKAIAQALRFRAEQMGWSNSKMAYALGMQRSHFNEVLHGKRPLSIRAVRKAFALGVPARILLAE